MRKVLIGGILAALSLVAGCVSIGGSEDNYAKFYTPASGIGPSNIAEMRSAPAPVSPQVVHVANWDSNIANIYERQGYVLIGYSGFTSGRSESDEDAINQGIAVGADLVVILSPEYQGTVTAGVPITTPNTTTSYSSGNATAYGAGAPVTAYGNSTTTTYGSSTSVLPITVQRSAYGAGYFVKKRYRFGIWGRDLTDGERQQLQTNRGVYVTTVVDNTPAYNADVLPGDVILAINGQAPNGVDALTDFINADRGQTVELTIFRAGKILSKRVSILE
jgi:PDZ domain